MTVTLTGASYAQNGNQIEDVGGWTIVTKLQPHAEIDPLCVLDSPSDRGTSIRFHNPRGTGYTARGKGYFQVYTDRIISDGEKLVLEDASIRIDSKERWKRTVSWTKLADGRGSLSVLLDDKIDELIRPFAAGRETEIVVSTPDGKEHSFKVKLAGSHRAFTVYEKCLAKVRVAPE